MAASIIIILLVLIKEESLPNWEDCEKAAGKERDHMHVCEEEEEIDKYHSH